MERIRMHYIFHGEVQGVGFRYRAAYSARQYAVSGWVENRWDGTVEMEAEGTRADLDAMLAVLQNLRWGSIDAIDTERIPTQGDSGFSIR